jgi:hypothetical protein
MHKMQQERQSKGRHLALTFSRQLLHEGNRQCVLCFGTG